MGGGARTDARAELRLQIHVIIVSVAEHCEGGRSLIYRRVSGRDFDGGELVFGIHDRVKTRSQLASAPRVDIEIPTHPLVGNWRLQARSFFRDSLWSTTRLWTDGGLVDGPAFYDIRQFERTALLPFLVASVSARASDGRRLVSFVGLHGALEV